ncbi:MAG: hypothetical protein KKF27_21155 [Gammaproteobacteria bacterium]|nr:hypothetical protein [Gammaproteobacteria bacterium]
MSEWIAYSRLEPFGHDTLSFLLGQITSMVYNVNRAKGYPVKTGWDFAPIYRDPKEPQSPDEMQTALLSLVDKPSRGGKRGKKGKKKKKITKTKRLIKREKMLAAKENENG